MIYFPGIIRSCTKRRQEPGDLRDELRGQVQDDGGGRDREGCRRGREGEGGRGCTEEERKIRKEINCVINNNDDMAPNVPCDLKQ